MTIYPTRDIEIELSDEEIKGDLIQNHERNRSNLRKKALSEFLKEKAGDGTGDLTSIYRYNVETLKDGNKIYITRPAVLNKGFDFIIHVSGYKFSNNKDNPTHVDIFNDIRHKIAFVRREQQNKLKADLFSHIEKIFFCVNVQAVTENIKLADKSFYQLPGFTLEMLLKIIKWFFIEQDIRYWNWSGRKKFMNEIRDILAS